MLDKAPFIAVISLFSRIQEEIAVVFERDPAARNTWVNANTNGAVASNRQGPMVCPPGLAGSAVGATDLTIDLVNRAARRAGM